MRIRTCDSVDDVRSAQPHADFGAILRDVAQRPHAPTCRVGIRWFNSNRPDLGKPHPSKSRQNLNALMMVNVRRRVGDDSKRRHKLPADGNPTGLIAQW